MKAKSYLLLLLFLGFASKLSLAQDRYRANIKSFTTNDGLSHLDVNCFEKDSKGILWIGTRDGLNRFDGQKFKIFNKKNGLTHNNINTLFNDKEVLWCVHQDRNTYLDLLSIFHINQEKVLTFKEYLGNNLPFQQSQIQQIYKLDSTLIIKTKKQKTYSYHSKNGLRSLPFIKKSEEIRAILKNGAFWVLDFDKSYLHLRKLDKNGKELFIIEKKDIPFSNSLMFIEQDKKGISHFGYSPIAKERLWFEIDEKGVFEKKEASLFWTKEHKIPLISQFCKFYPQFNAYRYAVLDTCALLSLDKKILYKNILPVKNSDFSLADSSIIWIANKNDGFFQIEFQKNKFTKLFSNEKTGGFRGIIKIRDRTYFNSHNQFFSLDSTHRKVTKHFDLSLISLKDKNDNLWSFEGRHLMQFDTNLKKTASFDVNHDNSRPAWSIYQDKNQVIWYSDLGLKSFNPKTEKLQKMISKEFPEIEKSIVYYFYEKENGNILLCTTTGLYEMELGKGIIARYWSAGKGKYYLPASDFRHLYFDKANQSYYLATNGKGLIEWNTQANSTKVHTFNHRAANIIHAVYTDKFGFLWLSTENGIIQFEKKTGIFKVYSTQDGTSTHEFNRISHFQDEKGRIYFGGIQGVTTFEPKDFYQDFNNLGNAQIIPLEISQYKEDKQQIENVTGDYLQKKHLNFYPNDRFLTFIFALNNYKYSQGAIYYYKLKNIDRDWTITKNNKITISGMPYGEQILEVKALLENGKFTKEILEIPILIHKPFYLQWWFFVLNFLIIFGITLLYIRYRTQKLELQKIILEKEVKKRTLKIEEQTEKLIALDKTKSRFFANVSHELRTPLTLIKAPIQSLIKKEKLSKEGEYLLQKANENTNNLLTLVNEILDLTKLDNQKLKLEEEKVLLYNFVRQILSNFQSIAQMQEIEMTLEYFAQKELQILLDKNKFQKILNNLLSNALKFTPSKGKITISIEDLTSKILLKVSDTGRGIPSRDIPHVFERYFQSSQNKKAEGGLGIGLALSMELVKLWKGKMWLESSTKSPNQGTTFFVEFRKREVLNMLSTQDVLAIEKDYSKQKNEKKKLNNKFSTKKTEKTILIVEDNIDLRAYLSFILSRDYQVLTAENGQKAIEILAKGQVPNLIISDLMMPVMDGYEFLETVKKNEHWAGLPFIMLTARAASQDKLKALRIGVDDYISKPFEEEELLVRIANLLKNHTEKIKFIDTEQENTSGKRANLDVSLEDRKWLENFENLVLKNLNSSLFSIDYLAELIKINRVTLYKKTKTLTGLTPNQYIRSIRLKIAKDFLQSNKYENITEVADHSGFKNVTYFRKIFKKEFGKSPEYYLN